MLCRRLFQTYSCKLYVQRNIALLAQFNNNNNSGITNSKLESPFLQQQRCMAGHNKWSNIKNIKAAKDDARSKIIGRISNIIKVAIHAGKSNNPKVNDQLANAIDYAKKNQVPTATIDRLLKGSESDKPMLPFLYELKGPGGSFMIIDILTDSVNRSRQEIRRDLKFAGLLPTEVSCKYAFDYKGTIEVEPVASKINLDSAIDVAIEVGAEEVVEVPSIEDKNVLQFTCEPRDLFQVKTKLVERGCEVVKAELAYLPKHTIPLTGTDSDIMGKIYSLFDERNDIVGFYVNAV